MGYTWHCHNVPREQKTTTLHSVSKLTFKLPVCTQFSQTLTFARMVSRMHFQVGKDGIFSRQICNERVKRKCALLAAAAAAAAESPAAAAAAAAESHASRCLLGKRPEAHEEPCKPKAAINWRQCTLNVHNNL